MLDLTSAEIHLWLLCCREISDVGLLERCRGILSFEEQERERRFRDPADQHRHRLTRTLVRTVLSRYAPIEPAQWRFQADRYGRPQILNTEEAARALSFNIAHTRGVVLLAVTAVAALGVDVESVRERTSGLEIAARYFATSELAQLQRLPPAEQQQRFIHFWTLKESYIKARGMGLAMPLDQFGFELAPPGVALRAQRELDANPERWRFWLLGMPEEHIAAVCALGNGAPQSIVTRKFVPFAADQPLEPQLIAQSG